MRNTMISKLMAATHLQESEAMAIEKIIRDHSLAAVATVATLGYLPGIGPTVAGIIAKGFTWTMLFRICVALGIDINKDALKSFASAVTAKIAAYLAALLAAGILASLAPGMGNLCASALSMLLAYVMVYSSGLLFIGMMNRVVNRAGVTAPMTSEEIIHQIEQEEITRQEIARAAQEAIRSYNETQKETPTSATASV